MKVLIIGAGIAGMAAGIYARQSGFEAEIFEAHTMAGGNSTSWKRNGYVFEGGMHWLVGSSKDTPLHKLWRETGALQDNNPIYNRDPFLTYCGKEGNIALYRDIEKLTQSFLAISPQDKKAIHQLAKDIRVMMHASMPITDIKGVKVKQKSSLSAKQMLTYAKAGRTMMRLNKMTVREYVAQFQHPALQEVLKSVIPMEEYSAMSMIFTLGGLAANDSGYPKGGSLQMAQNMAKTFTSLGGAFHYQSKVDSVHIVDGKACGLWSQGKLHEADAVIVANDTLTAVDRLFEQPLQEPWMKELREQTTPVNCTFFCFGVTADLTHLPENMVLPLQEPFAYAGKLHDSLALNNYASFEDYAPKGCTSLTMMLFEDTYDAWKQASKDGSYQEKKQQLAATMIHVLEQALPEIKGKVEVWDIATPVTYERYCGTYRGSWMSVMHAQKQQRSYPCKSTSIQNLYFAGQRLLAPGGLPIALTTGRSAVQHLCKDNKQIFQNNI